MRNGPRKRGGRPRVGRNGSQGDAGRVGRPARRAVGRRSGRDVEVPAPDEGAGVWWARDPVSRRAALVENQVRRQGTSEGLGCRPRGDRGVRRERWTASTNSSTSRCRRSAAWAGSLPPSGLPPATCRADPRRCRHRLAPRGTSVAEGRSSRTAAGSLRPSRRGGSVSACHWRSVDRAVLRGRSRSRTSRVVPPTRRVLVGMCPRALAPSPS